MKITGSKTITITFSEEWRSVPARTDDSNLNLRSESLIGIFVFLLFMCSLGIEYCKVWIPSLKSAITCYSCVSYRLYL